MDVSLFDYDLPRNRIAVHPVSPRDSARLLEVLPKSGLCDHVVRDLPDLLRAGDVLVVNDTKVIPALLEGQVGAGKVSVTLHMRVDACTWKAFAKPAKKLLPGREVRFGTELQATVTAKGDGGEVTLAFHKAGEALRAALLAVGAMPLPPYIPRPDGTAQQDHEDYQTMFAAEEGAVAAPTAGLHFTPALDQALAAAGIGRETLTLHVGAGTFLPVKAEDTDDHVMHEEWARLSVRTAERLNAARAAGGRLVAVGTTVTRTLESAVDTAGVLQPFEGETRLFITPGFRFRAVDMLMTNFHLPRSTLLMLVSAFAGRETMLAAYAHAIEAGYRFYSYGDACLLHPQAEVAS